MVSNGNEVAAVDAPKRHTERTCSSRRQGRSVDAKIHKRLHHSNNPAQVDGESVEGTPSHTQPAAHTTNAVRRRRSRMVKESRSRPKWMDAANAAPLPPTPVEGAVPAPPLHRVEESQEEATTTTTNPEPAGAHADDPDNAHEGTVEEGADRPTVAPTNGHGEAARLRLAFRRAARLAFLRQKDSANAAPPPSGEGAALSSCDAKGTPHRAEASGEEAATTTNRKPPSRKASSASDDLDDTHEGTENDEEEPVTPTTSFHGTVEAARLAFLKQKNAGLLHHVSPKREGATRRSPTVSPKRSGGRRALRSKLNGQT